MAGKVVQMNQERSDNNVWTINKKLSEGDKFFAMHHQMRVVSILEWKGEYAVARVEDLGPAVSGAEVAPLRFDGRFGR